MSRQLRLALFGDGTWATDTLLRLQATSHRVVAVVLRAQPSDESLAVVAHSLGLSVLQPTNVNTPDVIDTLASLGTDLGVSIAYNQILRQPLLASTRLGFINIHAGKLPFYRGRNVINWAIINGEPEVGLTVHMVDDGIDTGPILLQQTLPITWTDTYGDVLGRVVAACPSFIVEAIELLASGAARTTPQADLVGNYFGGRQEGDEWLDWEDTSVNLHNKVRGITRPGPGARTLLGAQTVIVWRAFYDPTWPCYIATPGQIVGRRSDGVVVKTGDSTLLVQEIQVGDQAPAAPCWRIGTRLGVNLAASLRALTTRLEALERATLQERG